jgi:hypothetical protein
MGYTYADFDFTFFIICITIVGLYFIFRKNKDRQYVSARVDNANCYFSSLTNYTCDLIITYSYNNTTFSNKPLSTSKSYKSGDSIDIYIDPNNPTDYSKEPPSFDYLIGFILVLPFFFFSVILYRYIKRRQK